MRIWSLASPFVGLYLAVQVDSTWGMLWPHQKFTRDVAILCSAKRVFNSQWILWRISCFSPPFMLAFVRRCFEARPYKCYWYIRVFVIAQGVSETFELQLHFLRLAEEYMLTHQSSPEICVSWLHCQTKPQRSFRFTASFNVSVSALSA